MFCEVKLTFGQKKKYDQFIYESVWTIVPNLKKLPRVPKKEAYCTYRQKDRQPETITHPVKTVVAGKCENDNLWFYGGLCC